MVTIYRKVKRRHFSKADNNSKTPEEKNIWVGTDEDDRTEDVKM